MNRSRRRTPASPYIVLPPRQRRAYLIQAAMFAVAGPLISSPAFGGRPSLDAVLWPAGWLALTWSLAVISFRASRGWVHLGPDGLHTSRLWRGKFLRWDEITDLSPRTTFGSYGRVTVVRVRTRSGRTYVLPAPRSTTAGTEKEFDRRVRQLRRQARG